jgi:hypothetical protein
MTPGSLRHSTPSDANDAGLPRPRTMKDFAPIEPGMMPN